MERKLLLNMPNLSLQLCQIFHILENIHVSVHHVHVHNQCTIFSFKFTYSQFTYTQCTS